MKIVEEHVNVASSGITKKIQFRVEASAKAFQILSKTGYQNPIRAICRELSCNAIDSHIAKGTTDRFEITLPNWTDANFRIRDYGIGLSPEQIETVYTSYFTSDKNDSNDFIGGIGVGAKSIFAYGNMASIISIVNGIRYVYVANIGEEQLPELNLIHSGDTEEKDGVEVSLLVQSNDFAKFANELEYVLESFDDDRLPIVDGQLWQKKQKSPMFDNGDIQIFDNLESFYSHHVLIMGGVAYNISELITDLSLPINTNESIISILAKIGEVDIQPFREGLQGSKRTLDYIRNKIEACIQSIKEKYLKEVESLSGYEKMCLFVTEKRKYCRKMLKFINGLTTEYPEFVFSSKIIRYWQEFSRGKRVWKQQEISGFRFMPSSGLPVVFRTDKPNVSGRILSNLREKNLQLSFDSLVLVLPLEHDIDKFCAEFGDMPKEDIRLVSELPKIKRATETNNTRLGIFEYKNSYYVKHSWRPIDQINKEDIYIYVEKDGLNIKYNGTIKQPSFLNQVYKQLNMVIVGINPSKLPIYRRMPNFISLENYIKDEIDKELSLHNLSLQEAHEYINLQSFDIFSILCNFFKDICLPDDLENLAVIFEKYRNIESDKLYKLRLLLQYHQYNYTSISIKHITKMLFDRFPLLRFIETADNKESRHLKLYVKAILKRTKNVTIY